VANCNAANLNGQTYNVAYGNQLALNFTTCSMFFISATGTSFWGSMISSGGNDFLYASPRFDAAGPGFGAMNPGTFVVYFRNSGSGAADGSFTIVAASSGGGGGGGGSSSSSSSTPVTETLSLSVAASGATCTGGNPTGYSGSWLTLPSADQCSQSGPTAKPGAKLLGWSTSANFPIARAQAQIDKKWGAIDEVIDGVRMIFIPAGQAVFVSGSNNLFPVWSI
jgi:hypothetical protein